MKKAMALILSLGMLFVITGCGSSGSSSAGKSSTSSGEKVYEIKFETVLNEASYWYQMGERISKNLEEQSGGRIKMTCYANSQLAGGNQQKGCENLIDNTTQMDVRSAMIWSVIDEKLGVFAIPFFYDSTDAILNDIQNGDGGKAYTDVFSKYGVRMEGLAEYGPRCIATNKPLTSYEDIKGMKIRVASVSLHLDSMKAFGANPMAMNWSEMYTGLQQGTVDGMEAPAQILIDNTIPDVCKYIYNCGWVMDPGVLTINQEFYDSLPADLQKILDDVCTEALSWEIEQLQAANTSALASLSKDYGCTVTDIQQTDLNKFKSAMESVVSAYEKTVGADYLNKFRT